MSSFPEGQEELTYEQAKNHVCEECGHYMSWHEFVVSEVGSIAVDENDNLVELTDKEVFEDTGHHIGEKAAFTKLCYGKKGVQEQFDPKDDIENACDCECYVDSLR